MKKMKRKYLSDIGVTFEDTPRGYCKKKDKRQPIWKEQRKTYGFDEREVWDLSHTLFLFLYERLMMYNEINCINTSFHTYEYKGEALTLQDCIDRMIEGLRIAINIDNYNYGDCELKKIDDIFPILALCKYQLWY